MVLLKPRRRPEQASLLAACTTSRPAPAAHLGRRRDADEPISFADIRRLPEPEWADTNPASRARFWPGRYTVGALVPSGQLASVPLLPEPEPEPLADWERELLALPEGEPDPAMERVFADMDAQADAVDAWYAEHKYASIAPGLRIVHSKSGATGTVIKVTLGGALVRLDRAPERLTPVSFFSLSPEPAPWLAELRRQHAERVMRSRNVAFEAALTDERVASAARCEAIAADVRADDSIGEQLAAATADVAAAFAARPELRHDTALLMALAPVVAMLKGLVA